MRIVAQWIYSNLWQLVVGFLWQSIWGALCTLFRWSRNKTIGVKEKLKKSYTGILPIDQAEPAYVYTSTEQHIEYVDEQTLYCIPQDCDVEVRWNTLLQNDFFPGLTGVSIDVLKECFANSVKEIGIVEDNREIIAVRRVVCNRIGKDEQAWAKLYLYHTDVYTKELMNCLFRNLCKVCDFHSFTDAESVVNNFPFVYGFQINLLLLNSQGEIVLKFQRDEQGGKDVRTVCEITEIDFLQLNNLKTIIEDDCRKQGIVVSEIKLQNIYFDIEPMNIVIGAEAKVKGDCTNKGYEICNSNTKGLIRFLREKTGVSNSCTYSLMLFMSRNCIKEAIKG